MTGGGGDGAILFRLRLVSALMSLCQISAGPCSAAGTPSIFSLNLGPSLGIIWGLSGDCGVLERSEEDGVCLAADHGVQRVVCPGEMAYNGGQSAGLGPPDQV